MDTIFLITENSQTSERNILYLTLRRGAKSIALSNLSTHYTWKNIKNSYNHHKFKILGPKWNDKFELPDG